MESEFYRQIGSMGGLARVAKHGGLAATAPARRGFLAKFETAADPDAALRAHMRRLSYSRTRTRQYGRTERQIAASIAQIVAPPTACKFCYDERGEPFPDGYTTHTCDPHVMTAWQMIAA